MIDCMEEKTKTHKNLQKLKWNLFDFFEKRAANSEG